MRLPVQFMTLVLLIINLTFIQAYGFSIEKNSEAAILEGDWQSVIEIMEKDNEDTDCPVARLIMGHACLAKNKNNESLLFFGSVNNEQDLQQWFSYSKALTESYPQNYIAHYLLGDAYARLGKYDEAIRQFDLSSKYSKSALPLIGRGVVKALKGNMNGSLLDLSDACAKEPELAGAWTELGILWVRMEVPEAAINALDEALKHNKSFALVHLAKGAALYGQGKDYFEEAAMETETAVTMLPHLSNIAEYNRKILSVSANKAFDEDSIATNDAGQGTTLEARSSINLYITDFGINQWKPEQKMFQDFSHAENRVLSHIPKEGQILIPMPADTYFNRMSQSDKVDLRQTIFEGMKKRVDLGISDGNDEFEIQIVQNIDTKAYFNRERQEAVREFGAVVYDALGMLHQYLEDNKKHRTSFSFYGGSNGTVAFTENVKHWKPYIEKAHLYDGRASEQATISAIEALGPKNVRIFNTAGDWPAPNNYLKRSIGNHDVPKDLKRLFPDLTTIWLDPIDRLDYVGKGHVSAMVDGSKFLAKEFNGKDYLAPTQMRSNDLRDLPTTPRELALYNEYNISRQFRRDSTTWSEWLHSSSAQSRASISSTSQIGIDSSPVQTRKFGPPPGIRSGMFPPGQQGIPPLGGIGGGGQPPKLPGGFTAKGVAKAWVDKGDWSFVIESGLLYK